MATYTAGKGKTGSRAVKKKTARSSRSGAPYRGGLIDKTAKTLRKARNRAKSY